MSFEEQNRRTLIDYFVNSGKGTESKSELGLEVEHFVVRADDLQGVPYSDPEGRLDVHGILEYLSTFYPERSFTREGDLIGLAGPTATVTLEPAAQVEVSIAPYSTVADVMHEYNAFRGRLDPFLAEHGCKIVSEGCHPRNKARELPLIPKQRYRFMDDYFAQIGTHGERMMRASTSTQVSIDYLDEADAVRKMRVAQALSVVLASLTDDATMMEGEPATARLTRFNLWRDVDDARCGSVPGLFEEGYGFSDYVDWVLRTCPIFITRAAADDPEGPSVRGMAGKTAEEAYADAPLTDEDIEHLLSMFWPDVRLKRFVEIRPADAMPAPLIAAYVALIKGLFYSEDSLCAVEEAFGVKDGIWPLDDQSTNRALAEVRAQGDAALIYGRPLVDWEDFVLSLSRAALDEEERAYLEPLAERTEERHAGVKA